MSYCLNCRGTCFCADPTIPGRHATYDPDRGGWVLWEVWRERIKLEYRVRERARRDRAAARDDAKAMR